MLKMSLDAAPVLKFKLYLIAYFPVVKDLGLIFVYWGWGLGLGLGFLRVRVRIRVFRGKG
jgi:hypothetical protein